MNQQKNKHDRRINVEEHLLIDTDLVREVLTGFIRDELSKAGFERAVIGLSGGIDSAVSCFLAVDALGPENVLALRMPYRNSSTSSLEDAQKVIDQLGVASDTVDITPMVEPLFDRFPDMDAKRRGNVMARERMIILYDRSEAWQGLVIGTGNKSEGWMGYTTLYGDSVCAINPIGDLYKTQVRQLAEALGVPQSIRTKPPSADLWVGQTDEGEMGLTYTDLDQVLYLLFDAGCTTEETIETTGSERVLVEKIQERVQRSEYKRRMPIVAKLSTRAVGE